MKFNNSLKLLLLIFVAVNLSYGQFSLESKLPISSDVTVKKLSNGLTYYIRQNKKPENKVELRLVVKVGSIVEKDNQQGLAHFVEHMAFNGSKHFQKNELVSFLQSIGVKFGSDLNAYTGFDETVYILPIPLDKPENLENGFLVLEDWASNLSFSPEEIEKERGVVLEEERSGKGANQRMRDKTLPVILKGSKFAKRLPIGKTEIIKKSKPKNLVNFYKDWYRPDLMAVIIVGDIDPAVAEAKVKQHFEHLKNPLKEKERIYESIPSYLDTRGMVVTDQEATNHILQLLYSPVKSKIETTIGDYWEQTVKNIVMQLLGNRLKELTEQSEAPFIFGGMQSGSFIGGYENFSGYAVVGTAGVQKAIEAVVTENARAKKFGFTSNELEREKKSTLKLYEQFFKERDKTESENLAAELIRNFLVDEPIPGIENEYNYQKYFIPLLTLKEVNDVAKNIIPDSSNGKLLLLLGPEKADFSLPNDTELIRYISEAEKTTVTPYIEKDFSNKLIQNDIESGSISRLRHSTIIGITELVLSNGVKVVFKQTDFKNDQVLFSGFRNGGASVYDDEDLYNAQYATSIISQMGVGDFSPLDLTKFLAGKTLYVRPFMDMTSENVSGESSTDDLETMLQLVYLNFTKPRRDEELFKSFINKRKSLTQRLRSNPDYVFSDTVQALLYNNNIRAPRMASPQDFDKIDLDRVLEIYKERFGNARGWTFFFVGNFERDTLFSLITKYIGSLPATEDAPPSLRDLGIRPVSGVVKKDIYIGEDEKSIINIYFTGEADYSEISELKMDALIETINIKLIEILREELSSIYSGGMSGSLDKYPYPHYTVKVSLPCGPENVGKLIKATFDELKSILDNGPTEKDLQKFKEGFYTKYDEEIKNNDYWLNSLSQSFEYGTSPLNILNMKKLVEAITIEDLKVTAKQYFNTNNYFQAVKHAQK